MRRLPLGALIALGVLGCSRSQLIDVAMSGAAHASHEPGMRVGERLVLAGDLHCHVLPPDAPHHVSRRVAETVNLAKKEGLDFVVLTPHVPSRFFMDEGHRDWVLATQQRLRAELALLRLDVIVVPGFEYTDHRYGHVGMSFADPADVLSGLSTDDARAHPERFFERWAAQGGLFTINHPVNHSVTDAPFAELRNDMSWRAFSGGPTPPEIAWITKHAQAVETFNESVTYLRDQFIVGDEGRSLREATHLIDAVSRQQHRRIAAVGGSDSHGRWLRATTFVLAKERSAVAIRDAIAAGRTCVRGPEACSLQVRSQGGVWQGVGDAVTTKALTVEARASRGDVTFVVNGANVARGASDEVVSVRIPAGRCAIVRAIVADSWSSGVYVNCLLPQPE